MKRVEFVRSTKMVLDGVVGFMKRTVTKFGTGAKVGCPKEYLGKKVYLVVVEEEPSESTEKNRVANAEKR